MCGAPSASPAAQPCRSCPYRRDVPSGLWDASEYGKLPAYDEETYAQPTALFYCHTLSGRVCAGWAGCHDMEENLALRLAAFTGDLTSEEIAATRDYQTTVELFPSGRAAADHGLTDIEHPGPAARRAIRRLRRAADSRTRSDPPPPLRG